MAAMSTKTKRPRRKRPREGETTDRREPVWEPLLGLARVYIDEFMWMFEVELDNGKRLQAYKHYWTRRYLHLDENGEAWFYRDDGRYEQDTGEIVDLFSLVVRWHYPGQHREESEEWLAERGERAEEPGIPGYTPAHGEGDGFDA